jgi:peroxiredoxin
MSKKKILSTAIVAIVIANLIVWGYVFLEKINFFKADTKNPKDILVTQKLKLPHFNMETAAGKFITTDKLNAKLNILIFFTFEDCASCLYEAEFWSEASHFFRESDVIILAVTNETKKEIIQEFSNEYRISFPIIIDKDSSLKEKVIPKNEISFTGITTPFKVFLNRNHEIIYVEGPVKDSEKQSLFRERVSRVLSDHS